MPDPFQGSMEFVACNMQVQETKFLAYNYNLYRTEYSGAMLGLGLVVFSDCCQHCKLVDEISSPISIFRFSEV
jgi:hypothetical protein